MEKDVAIKDVEDPRNCMFICNCIKKGEGRRYKNVMLETTV